MLITAIAMMVAVAEAARKWKKIQTAIEWWYDGMEPNQLKMQKAGTRSRKYDANQNPKAKAISCKLYVNNETAYPAMTFDNDWKLYTSIMIGVPDELGRT